MASMTSLKADLGEYLREQRHSARLSLRQLAEVAGVSNPYLSQIERGLKKPSAEILQQLAKGLRISAESLYVRAGILEEQDERQVETKSAILTDPLLAERQKRVLLDIYDAFCAENLRATAAAAASDAGGASDSDADASDSDAAPAHGAGSDAGPDSTTKAGADVRPDAGGDRAAADPAADPGRSAAPDAATERPRTARTTRQGRARTARTTRTTTPKGSS
jgi:transcriptional regulator with XRE-family HTH domain